VPGEFSPFRNFEIDRHVPAPRPVRRAAAIDPTIRLLLGAAAWHRLAGPVRRRFAVKPLPGQAFVWAGTMEVVHLSRIGRAFAGLLRLCGMPLAPWTGRDVPVTITLTAAGAVATQWARRYDFARASVVVASRKTLDAKFKLLELTRGGLGMRLSVAEVSGALCFASERFFWRVGRLALPIPLLLTPGRLTVDHEELGGGNFRFSLAMRHPLCGLTVFQTGVFRAVEE
jgi:hypothetical protein